MNLIRQLDKGGCTTACIAMIGGTSYEHIRGNVFRDESHEMKRFLDSEFNIKSRFIKFTKLKDIKNDCILVIAQLDLNIGPGCSLHAIVYDAKKKKILDPDISNIKDLSGHNVVQCLEIIK